MQYRRPGNTRNDRMNLRSFHPKGNTGWVGESPSKTKVALAGMGPVPFSPYASAGGIVNLLLPPTCGLDQNPSYPTKINTIVSIETKKESKKTTSNLQVCIFFPQKLHVGDHIFATLDGRFLRPAFVQP